MKNILISLFFVCLILNANTSIINPIDDQMQKLLDSLASNYQYYTFQQNPYTPQPLQISTQFSYPSLITQPVSIGKKQVQHTTRQTTINTVPNPISLPSIVKDIPDNSTQQKVGAPYDVTFDIICFARILQQGLLRLPQLTAMKPLPLFKQIKQQVVAGRLYNITYDEPTYHAEIIGWCQNWVEGITLGSAKFTLKM